MLRLGRRKSNKLEKPVDLPIHKGDTVMIVTGRRQEKDGLPKVRGTTGEVLRTLPKKGQIVVKGYNVVTKATKPSMANMQGGLVKKEAPFPASRAMPVCPACQKPTRVRYQRPDPKKPRVRVCARKGCGSPLAKKV